MIALIQRVTEACVAVDGEAIATIGPGLLALIGVEKADTQAQAGRLAERLLAYRVFPDADGRMNLSVTAAAGSVLLVPQFTLAADTGRGNRPSFGRAAPPQVGQRLFEVLTAEVAQTLPGVQTGRFGANMQVTLVNDGPVTFWLQTGH